MSKAFFTSNRNLLSQISYLNLNQNFSCSVQLNKKIGHLIAFNKKISQEENFVEKDDSIIVGVGSIIYKGTSKKEALDHILQDFRSPSDIPQLREEIVGNYMIAVQKGQSFYFFNDLSRCIPIYYFSSKENILIGNDLYIIAKALVNDENLSINDNNFLERVFQNGIIGNRTMFNNIKKLNGNQYLEYDLERQAFSVKEIKNSFSFTLLDAPRSKLVESYAELLYTKVVKVVKNSTNIGIFMTGGLDSRVILSAYLRAGSKPTLFYGKGNSALTNTKEEDLQIVKEIAERYDLKLVLMDWSTPVPIDKDWDELIDKYGFFADVYGGNRNVINEIEKIKNIDFIEFGYMGESIRDNRWMDKIRGKTFDIEFLTDLYLNKYNLGIYRNRTRLKETVSNDIRSIYQVYENIDEENLTLNEYQILDNEYRKISDTELLNLINQYVYSISASGQNDLLEFAARIPYKYKKGSSFSIDVINYLYKDLVNVPVLSHGRPLFITKSTLESKNHNKIMAIKKSLLEDRNFLRIGMSLKFFAFPFMDKEKYSVGLRSNDIKLFLLKKYKRFNRSNIRSVAYASLPYIARYFLLLRVSENILNSKKGK